MDHFLRLAFPLAAAATLTGCVHMQIDETAPSLETLTLLRTQAVPQIALGEFKEVGGTSLAKNINVRGSTLRAPGGGNFADFLKKSFQSELVAAGTYAASSTTAITGTLEESRATEDMAKGYASLGAIMAVSRDGTTVFSKRYRAETRWRSDFIGAIAIPEAFRQYNGLYSQLVRTVFADPEFIAALKK